jgi:ABC-type Zn uptake system ZnuABC Zn-binding protein ZnuA
MKKLLFVAILGTLVACGESTSTTTATDSSAVVVDSTPVVVDSTPVVDTAKVDTTKH